MSGKKYFYALGQRAKSYGWSKLQGIEYYQLDKCSNYCNIYYDKGYRGLSI